MTDNYKFNISLTVINSLGRDLYRSITTIIGEAISNSWDADAKNVWIKLNEEKTQLIIKDDGIGMTSDDFQNKFLKIGYSKRALGSYKTKDGRPFIGRKGIGKLAMLSCANEITILSKRDGVIVGGVINNKELDEAIGEDKNSEEYRLNTYNPQYESALQDIEHGTVIIFDELNISTKNKIEYIGKAIALSFKFNIIDPNFNIYFNNAKITVESLKALINNTQIMWIINGYKDDFVDNIKKCKSVQIKSINIDNKEIKGYVATVFKPSQLTIQNYDERIGLDLFVNGRIREKDFMKKYSQARLVESYMYGSIHYDVLDKEGGEDNFTTAREGIKSSIEYDELINTIKEIFTQNIFKEWDRIRKQNGDPGDSESDKTVDEKVKRATSEIIKKITEQLFSGIKTKPYMQEILQEIKANACSSINSYINMFVFENLIREHIKNYKLLEYNPQRADRHRQTENNLKQKGEIDYEIRKANYPIELSYLSVKDLITFKNEHGLQEFQYDEILLNRFKVVRNAIAHTCLLSDKAKILSKETRKELERIVKESYKQRSEN